MTRDASAWLPPEVADRPIVRDRVGEAVQAWSSKWFSGVKLAPSRWETVRSGLWAQLSEHGRVRGKTVGLSCSDRGAMCLVAALLDAEPAELTPTEADRRIIEAFLEEALDDLLRALETALGSGAETDTVRGSRKDPRASGVRIGVGEAGGVLFWLGLPLSAVLPLCEASLPPPPAASQELDTRLGAVAGQEVSLQAILGSVKLQLGELGGLATGDVLILDRPLDEPFDVTIGATPLAGATLTQSDGWRAISLQPRQVRTV
ncbi:MAG: FliM/FliN family flagellar motor switch protein [Phenylobacterium sp.]